MEQKQYGMVISGTQSAALEASMAVKRAVEKWKKAPLHVRMAAGDYVEPLLSAMIRQQEAIARMAEQQAAIIATIEGGK